MPNSYVLKGGSTDIISLIPIPSDQNPEQILFQASNGDIKAQVVTYDSQNKQVVIAQVGVLNAISGALSIGNPNQAAKSLLIDKVGYYHLLVENHNYWPTGNDGVPARSPILPAIPASSGNLLLGARKPIEVYAANIVSGKSKGLWPTDNIINNRNNRFSVAWTYLQQAIGSGFTLTTSGNPVQELQYLAYYDAVNPAQLTISPHTDLPPIGDANSKDILGVVSHQYQDLLYAKCTDSDVPATTKSPYQAFQAMNLTWPTFFKLSDSGEIMKPNNSNFANYATQAPLPPNGSGGIIWNYTTPFIQSNNPLPPPGPAIDFSDGSIYLLRCDGVLTRKDISSPTPSLPPCYKIMDKFYQGISSSDPGWAINPSLNGSLDVTKVFSQLRRQIQVKETMSEWGKSAGLIPQAQNNILIVRPFVDINNFGTVIFPNGKSNADFNITSQFVDNIVIKMNIAAWLMATSTSNSTDNYVPPFETKPRNITFPSAFRPKGTLFRNIIPGIGPGTPIIHFQHSWIIRVGVENQNTYPAIGGNGSIFISNTFDASVGTYQAVPNTAGAADQFTLNCTYAVKFIQNGGKPFFPPGTSP